MVLELCERRISRPNRFLGVAVQQIIENLENSIFNNISCLKPCQNLKPVTWFFLRILVHSFFYKNNFIRTKALILGKRYEQGKNKARLSVPQNIRAVSRLAILKIIRTKRQNKAWLSLILYCM